MATLSPRCSASSIKWVESKVHLPARPFRSSSHVKRLEYGSMPVSYDKQLFCQYRQCTCTLKSTCTSCWAQYGTTHKLPSTAYASQVLLSRSRSFCRAGTYFRRFRIRSCRATTCFCRVRIDHCLVRTYFCRARTYYCRVQLRYNTIATLLYKMSVSW